ncbi:MAG: hypothetical protein E7635_00200 [Ruminococcaceae bacterium]|nr:hypothetical protein [Oscillospiraceae bacterium]
MKRYFSASLILLSLLFLFSCSENSAHDYICTEFDEMRNTLGGNVIIYTPQSTDSSDALISLYGKDGALPDELDMVDYAVVWYSDRLECADAAIFHLINATDGASVAKMCMRRASTLKTAAGIDMEIYSNGHFVCAYTKTSEELEYAVKSIINTK